MHIGRLTATLIPVALWSQSRHCKACQHLTDVCREHPSTNYRGLKLAAFAGMIARMKLESEFTLATMPPSEDWIATLNDLIEEARRLTGAAG